MTVEFETEVEIRGEVLVAQVFAEVEVSEPLAKYSDTIGDFGPEESDIDVVSVEVILPTGENVSKFIDIKDEVIKWALKEL